MDFQPANLFVRGASPGQGFSFGKLFSPDLPLTVYKYLNAIYHSHIIADPRAAVRLSPPIYVTTYMYYTALEALRALAIPGLPPTHVLEINLPSDIVELQGPSFVTPLDPSAVTALRAEHRDGNGVQLLIHASLQRDWIGRVIEL